MRKAVLLNAAMMALLGVSSLTAQTHILPVSCEIASCDSCVSSCDGCSPCSSSSCPLGDCLSGWEVSGWVNGGFIWNTDDPTSNFNGPYNGVDRANEGMLNQAYLVIEKALPQCGHGLGGRIDFLYGEDFYLAESIGMEKNNDGSPRWNDEYYGFAIPQAYVSWGQQDLSLQLGHFYSIVGYEGLMAPTNFFYSKSYSYQFAGPFTHWGAQLNWAVNRSWNVQLGVHNGWDALERVDDQVGFIGKVRYDDRDTGCWTSFAIVTGDEANDPAGLGIPDDITNRTRYSWLVGLPLTCRADYVFHHWLGVQEAGALSGSDAHWYGIDQYLTYRLNRRWKAGMRFEWFHDEDGTRVGLNRPSNPNVPALPGDFYSFTAGLNYRPCCDLVLRPEFRADWYDGDGNQQPFNDGNDDSQFMLGVDAILSF